MKKRTRDYYDRLERMRTRSLAYSIKRSNLLARRRPPARARPSTTRPSRDVLPKFAIRLGPISAPKCFSVIRNPHEMLLFVDRIRTQCGLADSVVIDLSDVESIDADGVALLLKHISDARFTRGAKIRGSEPKREEVLRDLVACGFFEYVGSARRQGAMPQASGIIARKQKTVDNLMASDIVRHASTLLFGKPMRMPAVYTTLIECMANTKNHATRKDTAAAETWWLAVTPSTDRNTVRFAFIDAGVGLFESVNIRGLRKQFTRALGLLPNTKLLRQILGGQIESATGLAYRGKGLPRIRRFLDDGKISRLVIVANDVYADVGADDFRVLQEPFKGTLVYWEIRANCSAFELLGVPA